MLMRFENNGEDLPCFQPTANYVLTGFNDVVKLIAGIPERNKPAHTERDLGSATIAI